MWIPSWLPSSERHVTVIETTVAAGGSGGSALDTLPGEGEVCFVLHGSIDVQMQDERFALEAGDALTSGVDGPHSRSATAEAARILWMLALFAVSRR